MNKRRSLYNIIVGIGSQILSIILGILIPRLLLVNFGSEMNGFLNSIGQVFAYFALLEAGVGAATLQALYGPVGKNDRKSIAGIMAATDNYYRRTGKFYLLVVIALSILYPIVVDTEISNATMVIIILINGIPGVINYYVQGKYILLLQAEGKNYINTALTSIGSTLISIAKIALLLAGYDIVVIQLTYFVINLIKTLVLYIYVKKSYQWLELKCEPDYDSIAQKNAAFINQICDLIFRNTDTIILTVFCDLKVVSVYAMYTLLFSMIRTALDYVSQGFSFIMGQTYNQDIEKYIRLHDLYETYRMALIYALYNIALVFIIPFMKLYTSGVNDINYLDYRVAVLFVIFYLMTGVRACSSDLINYAQHFKLTQNRCILEAIINLTVSIIAVNFWGIYGVLVGTIVALLYRANDMILYANNRILNRSAWITYKKIISNTIIFVLITLGISKIPWVLESYVTIVEWACICGVIVVLIYFAVGTLIDKESFKLLKKIFLNEG